MGVNQSNSLHSSLHRKSVLGLCFSIGIKFFYMLVNLCLSKPYNRPTVTSPIHLAALTFFPKQEHDRINELTIKLFLNIKIKMK